MKPIIMGTRIRLMTSPRFRVFVLDSRENEASFVMPMLEGMIISQKTKNYAVRVDFLLETPITTSTMPARARMPPMSVHSECPAIAPCLRTFNPCSAQTPPIRISTAPTMMSTSFMRRIYSESPGWSRRSTVGVFGRSAELRVLGLFKDHFGDRLLQGALVIEVVRADPARLRGDVPFVDVGFVRHVEIGDRPQD